MRIFQRNILNVVAKSIASGIRIFHAYVPTALSMDYAAEASTPRALSGTPKDWSWTARTQSQK
jgi:hypothetical protein